MSTPPDYRKYFETLKAKWSSTIVARTDVKAFSGGVLNPGTMANEDSRGTGPKDGFMIGRKKVYTVDGLIDWMIERATF